MTTNNRYCFPTIHFAWNKKARYALKHHVKWNMKRLSWKHCKSVTHFRRMDSKKWLRKKCPYFELLWSSFSRIRTRIAPNTDTFHAVKVAHLHWHIQSATSTFNDNKGINNFDEENANLTTPVNNVNLNAAKLKDGCENLHHIFKYFW